MFAPASISVLPQARAQTCDEIHRAVSDGSFTWGVKESFRNYVEGNIARGAITVKDGASRSGGSVVYPASASSITGDSKGVVRFGGTVNFTGHNGVLDLTLSDIAMHIGGSKAELTADYSSRKFEDMNSHEPGPEAVRSVIACSPPSLRTVKAPVYQAPCVGAGRPVLCCAALEDVIF